MTVPHVGRYRLFQRALTGPLWTCRVCRESFKKGHLQRHEYTERRRAAQWWSELTSDQALAFRLMLLLRIRRSRRNLRRARWEYAVHAPKPR